MKVAVVGCAHGELDAIYAAAAETTQQSDPIDLIICAGDFQAVRNQNDLACMACPPKFRDMRTFHKYFSGESVATIPTIFIGGNHEASNHLQEIPLGGLVAPNMYFLGNAGVINYRGLRIGGISGVYTEHNYEKLRYERPPYPKSQVKSVYHMRKQDVDRMLRIHRPIDIFVSHDWPRGIWHHGDCDKLLAAKPFLRTEIKNNTFGNPGTTQVLEQLQPSYWFAAHIHVKFAALVKHAETEKMTKFLALDKVLPRRDFMQILDIPVSGESTSDGSAGASIAGSDEFRIEMDAEWLSVLRTEGQEPQRNTAVTESEIQETQKLFEENSVKPYLFPVSEFERHGDMHDSKMRHGRAPNTLTLQPRTVSLLKTLELAENDWSSQQTVHDQGQGAVPQQGQLPEKVELPL